MKNRLKQTMDYLPFILLVIYTISEWLANYVTNIQIPFRTYFGILLLLLNALVFIRHHKLAVLLTGLICLSGTFGIIMLSPAMVRYSIGNGTSLVFGDLYFIAIFIIHFIISFRYYTGILSKKYWQGLLAQLTNKNER